AAAPHDSPLARAVAGLSPADRGDIELYADARWPLLEKSEERLKEHKLGQINAVAGAIRFRTDGAALYAHVFGEIAPGAATGIAGAPPPPGLSPIAAGAREAVRIHVDPDELLPFFPSIDPKVKSELVSQLTGDVEIATSGRGLIGISAALLLKDPARVEAYAKDLCADTGGTKRRYAIGQITVRDHGCTGVFDPRLLLLPISIPPVRLSAEITGGRLVVLIGDTTEPGPELRRWDELVEGTEAKQTLASAFPLVAISRNLQIGPDVAAGAAFRAMSRLVDERS